jgi:hypothetical protein
MASDRPAGASRLSTYRPGLALPNTWYAPPNTDQPDVRAHTLTSPDIRGQRPPCRTCEVPTRRTCGPRTLTRLDAQLRRRTRRDRRLGLSRARPPHRLPRPTTYNNYGTGMRRFTVFCNEEGITPLEATAAEMLRFAAWLARAGIIVTNSLQPYFSAVGCIFVYCGLVISCQLSR